MVLLLLASLLFTTTLVSSMAAFPRDAVAALNGAEGFNDIDELTRYLDELKQYYTIVGRPRWDTYLAITDFKCLNVAFKK